MPMSPAEKLLNWYRRHGRTLPWRTTRDPYHILVSEIMLQQTQVDRVKDYYTRWLMVFPNWKALANASNAKVIQQWAGLGYNRRALMLRDVAVYVVKNGIPESEEGWREIKGIGPYTAAAVSAFAQKKRTMPIDTNIRRVLGRLLLGVAHPSLKTDKRLTQKAQAFLPKKGHYYDVPQAIFDLATSICTKDPECARCPLRSECPLAEKFLSGSVRIPKQSVKKPKERIREGKRFPDRIYRGRILKCVREQGSVNVEDVGIQIDSSFSSTDHVWIKNMLTRMERDGLIQVQSGTISLPR